MSFLCVFCVKCFPWLHYHLLTRNFPPHARYVSVSISWFQWLTVTQSCPWSIVFDRDLEKWELMKKRSYLHDRYSLHLSKRGRAFSAPGTQVPFWAVHFNFNLISILGPVYVVSWTSGRWGNPLRWVTRLSIKSLILVWSRLQGWPATSVWSPPSPCKQAPRKTKCHSSQWSTCTLQLFWEWSVIHTKVNVFEISPYTPTTSRGQWAGHPILFFFSKVSFIRVEPKQISSMWLFFHF